MEQYTILSPWAKSDHLEKRGISPRLDTLEGKTIGLYASFKEYHPFFMQEVERQLSALYPNTAFSHFTYTVDTCEVKNDPANLPAFRTWLDGVDGVIGCGADMGSCALYSGYNFAYMEALGKPAVLMVQSQYVSSATKGATARAYPGLRMVPYPSGMAFVPTGVDCRSWTLDTYRGPIAGALPEVVRGLLDPLTEAEKNPKAPEDWSDATFTGTLEQCNDWLYAHGWTNGTPVTPPTREAVDEMLKGTDLAPDYVVAQLPPMLGKATVEKIAINGVMAGCLPTYMPLLIAMVEGMADDVIKLEGWTCSNSGWAPTIVVNGPVRQGIGIQTGRTLLSPYTRASACLGRALGYLIMNVSGCRSGVEDMSGPGSDCRFGICFGENEEESPFPPLQTDYGFDAGDSTVTLFWPSEHTQLPTANVEAMLTAMCKLSHGGFDVGAMIVLPPEAAQKFAQAGISKADILNYMVEYDRRPSSQIPRAALGNNHPRDGFIFPIGNAEVSARMFWSTEHMFVVVAGRDWGMAYLGGGDHGGPVCKKAQLPKAWAQLCAKYGVRPEYVDY